MARWMTWAEPSPDGRLLAVGTNDGWVLVWDLERDLVAHAHAGSSLVVRLRWVGAGDRLLCAHQDGRVRSFVDRGARVEAELATGHGTLGALAVSGARDTFATGGSDRKAIVWDAATLARRYEVPPLAKSTAVTALAFAGDVLVIGRASGVFEALREGSEQCVAQGRIISNGEVSAIGTSPTGTDAVFGGSRGSMVAVSIGEDWVTRMVWPGTPPRPIAVNAISFAADGQRFLAACSDGAALLFRHRNDNLGTALGRQFWLEHPKPRWARSMIVASAEFAPDGRTVYCACFDGAVRVWDLTPTVPRARVLPIEPPASAPAPAPARAAAPAARRAVDPNKPLPARSNLEAHLYMDLHPCACGESRFDRANRVVQRGDDLDSVYEGACAGCGAGRRFEFAVPAQIYVGPGHSYGGADPSTIICPAEYLAVADAHAKRFPGTVGMLAPQELEQVKYSMAVAIAALEEVLKLIPPGAERLPVEALLTASGKETYLREPGRFRRIRLEAVLDTYKTLAARLYA